MDHKSSLGGSPVMPGGVSGSNEALRRSESQLQAVLESTTAGILAVDNDGKVVKANRRFAELWRIPGFLLETGDDRALLDFVLSQLIDPDAFLRKVEALYKSDAVDVDEIRFKDGRVFERVSCPMMLEGSILGRVWSFHDVTEQKRAEESLRLSNIVYEVALTANSTADINGVINTVNPAFVSLWGYTSKSEVLGRRISEFFQNPEEANSVVVALNRDGIWKGEFLGRRKDGSTFVAHSLASVLNDKDGRIIGYQSGVIDISARKQVEKALLTSERRYRLLAENSSDVIWTMNLDYEFTYISPTTLRLSGHTAEESLRNPLNKLIAPGSMPTVMRELAQLREDGLKGIVGRPRVIDVELVRKDGSTVWTEVSAEVVRDAADGRIIILGVTRDITERRRVEEALKETNRRLQDALKELLEMQQLLIKQERLIALGQMASGIAHDFNNALVPVLGYTELLLATPGIWRDEEKAVKMLGLIRTGAMNAAATVSNLRECYRPADGQRLTPVDLYQLVGEAPSLTRPRWKEEMEGKGITIDFRTEIAPVPPVMGDVNELRRLFTNLIFNAVDAMPHGGSITLRLYRDVPGAAAVIEVQDTGIGMSEEVLQRCLDPFFTTKSGRGVGLGLSISNGIAKRHGGTIEVESAPGKGSKFRVRIPLAGSHVMESRADKPPVSSPVASVSPIRVLFVDDEESARLLIARYLEADGHWVKTAVDGVDGLKCFKAGHFDLVIVDRAMPGMNGDALAAAIKAVSPGMPVIMLTGFGEIMMEQGEKPAAIDRILSKPPTRDDLRRAMLDVRSGRGRTPDAAGKQEHPK